MNILFITAFPPNQKTAGQDYTRRLLIDLLSKGHSISLIYADYPGHEVELPEEIIKLCVIKPSLINCIKNIFFHPFFTKRYSTSVVKLLNKIAVDFDMLYFDFSQVHIYARYVEHKNKVLMCHDVISQKFSRKGRSQLLFIKKSERRLLQCANQVITFSEKDSDILLQEYKINSNFVNFYLKNGLFKYGSLEVIKDTFCFYGAWNREENIECLLWFIEKVIPFIDKRFSFIIIGGGMPKGVKVSLASYPNIKILGFVNDPVLEIAKCQALIAPLHKGAGVKVKVIDALSSGTPVLGTSVAFEGIVDNKKNSLFFKLEEDKQYIKIINDWTNIKSEFKQESAIEFFDRYNKNHFTDLI